MLGLAPSQNAILQAIFLGEWESPPMFLRTVPHPHSRMFSWLKPVNQSKDKKKDMLVGKVLVGGGRSSSIGTRNKRGWLGKYGGNALYTYM